jgi:hypothetical protein
MNVPSRLFVLILLFGATLCRPASAQFVIRGGTQEQRDNIAYTVTTALHGIVLPDRRISVSILSADQMNTLLNSGPSIPHSTPDGPGSPSDDSDQGVVDGVYDAQPPVISLIDNNPSTDMEMTFVHEYGHHIWCYFATRADQMAYERTYNRERANHQMISDYAATCKEEGFAEDFAYFLMDPADLQRVAPGSFAFMTQLTHRLRDSCSTAISDDQDRTTHQ